MKYRITYQYPYYLLQKKITWSLLNWSTWETVSYSWNLNEVEQEYKSLTE